MDAISEDDNMFVTGLFTVFSWFKPNWELTLTDYHLQLIVQNYIGYAGDTSRLPKFYYQLYSGNFKPVGNILRNMKKRRIGNIMAFTTNSHTAL